MSYILSIGIRNFNGGEFFKNLINKFILAVNKNDLSNIVEIIIVDDFSKDNSREFLKNLNNLNNDSIRVFFNNENMGPHFTFLQTFFNSTGKYFWLFDNDDDFNIDHFQKLLEFLIKSDVDLIALNLEEFTDNNQLLRKYRFDYEILKTKSKQELIPYILGGDISFIPNIYIFKRDILLASIQDFGFGPHLDSYFVSKAFFYSKNFTFLADFFYRKRIHITSLNFSISVEDIQSQLQIPVAIYYFLKDSNLWEEKYKSYLVRLLLGSVEWFVRKIYISNIKEKKLFLDLVFYEVLRNKVYKWLNSYQATTIKDKVAYTFLEVWKNNKNIEILWNKVLDIVKNTPLENKYLL